MNDFFQAALRYAELGYRVFPCVAGRKEPLTTHGFHDASNDPNQVDCWWSKIPTANVAINAEGMLVVDIDGQNNPWPGDPERSADLARAGAIALTPRGGRHYLFRRPEGKDWTCSTSQLAPGVDIRTDGGYIVSAPSITEDGRYQWAPELELADPLERLPEPPAWLTMAMDALGETTTGSANTENASEDSNSIPSGQRNSTLARLAGTMRRVGMSAAEIEAALLKVNQDRCVPPLSNDEVTRIAASIARYEPDRVAQALAENHFDQMYAIPEEVDENLPRDPGPIPESLLRVPGFIEEVMEFTLATAPYPEPVLAFAGALTLQAVLAGRKVRDEMDNRTNLYVIGLANSGVGKDHARKVNTRILYEVGMAGCLGTSFASGEGIEDRLFEQPASLFQVDEIDGLLLRVSQARDARHEAMISMLLQMYSSASTVYVMRAKAGRERAEIDQPCLCLFGTAVPKHFYESLSPRLMTNGFLARLLILECGPRGEGRDAVYRPIPNTILEAARWWSELRNGGNLNSQHPSPRMVPATPEAMESFSQLRLRVDRTDYIQCERLRDDPGMALWARTYEKARRLAMIYACSVNRENPVITLEMAEWAGALAKHQTQRMLFMSSQHSHESEFDSKRKRLLDLLDQWRREHGDEWMPFWRINRRLPWSSREHDEVRETLLQQRLIESQLLTTGRRGRPGLFYRRSPLNAFRETPA